MAASNIFNFSVNANCIYYFRSEIFNLRPSDCELHAHRNVENVLQAEVVGDCLWPKRTVIIKESWILPSLE
jgi:hypothetical protein